MKPIITQLPKIVNPQEILKKEIKKRYGSKCPFCGEKKSFIAYKNSFKGLGLSSCFSWYGTQYEVNPGKVKIPFLIRFKSWFQKCRHWRIESYSCNTCGAKWLSPPYPNDSIIDQKTMQKFFENAGDYYLPLDFLKNL